MTKRATDHRLDTGQSIRPGARLTKDDAPYPLRDGGGRASEFGGMMPEHVGLHGARCAAPLHESQAGGLVELVVMIGGSGKDGSRQSAAAGGGFDEIERRVAHQLAHLIELTSQVFTEHVADVDAGEEVAIRAGASVGSGVVPELRMIQGKLDVVREPQRPGRLDPLRDRVAERHEAFATPSAPAGRSARGPVARAGRRFGPPRLRRALERRQLRSRCPPD